MGTSASSSGPASGVRLVPPWVEAPEDGIERATEGDGVPDEEAAEEAEEPRRQPAKVAAKGRFRTARLSLGRFGESGDPEAMRRGLGHYVGSGLGGSAWATRRMGGTARKAGALYAALDSLSRGTTPP